MRRPVAIVRGLLARCRVAELLGFDGVVGFVAGLGLVREVGEFDAHLVEDVVLIAREDLHADLGIAHRVVVATSALTDGPEVKAEGAEGGESG